MHFALRAALKCVQIGYPADLVELPTNRFEAGYSIQLSYGRLFGLRIVLNLMADVKRILR